MTKLKIGICGYGGLGHAHAAGLAGMDDIDVVAVCDKRPEQLAAQEVAFNIDTGNKPFDIRTCRTYTDFSKMLKREKLDVLVTALPTDLHAKFAIQAMNRGIHVFSEKPMALNTRQCAAMIAARDRNKVHLLIGQCLRFWPEYQILMKAVHDKTYGQLTALTMTRIGGYAGWASENWFNDHLRSGGAILDLHLHDVDWAIHALGKPRAITAGGFPGRTGGIDDVTALWEYDGCLVTIKGSWKYQAFGMTFQAFFENAAMDYGIHPNPALRVRKAGAAQDEILPVEGGSAYCKELRYLFECVRGEHANIVCPAESTRDSVRMIELERKAIQSHRWLKVS
jgi:predicted dehydrogenase